MQIKNVPQYNLVPNFGNGRNGSVASSVMGFDVDNYVFGDGTIQTNNCNNQEPCISKNSHNSLNGVVLLLGFITAAAAVCIKRNNINFKDILNKIKPNA